MKIFKLRYNSYGDELCGDLFSTMRKLNIRKNKMINNYKGFKEKNFSVEEIEVI